MYKYTLIVSQYWHSRHFFIVQHEPDFIEKARTFAAELMDYKRDEGCKRGKYLGDLDPEYVGDGSRRRYNINDTGDIYFLQSDSITHLHNELKGYEADSRRERRGFKRKEVTVSIDQHHDFDRVDEIVRKYFEVA